KGFLGHAIALTRAGFAATKKNLAPNAKPVPPEDRLWATAATVTASILGGAHIVRVHDVREMLQVARVADCLLAPHAISRASPLAALVFLWPVPQFRGTLPEDSFPLRLQSRRASEHDYVHRTNL